MSDIIVGGRAALEDYLSGKDDAGLFECARRVRGAAIGDKVYLRGLIELSNRCCKDCLYCGIRCSNLNVERYELDYDVVMQASRYAMEHNYGSVVLQSGEQRSRAFTNKIADCIQGIKALSDGKLGITISLGEQTRETYERWREAGAHRYLLRIESSKRELYQKIHPGKGHSYDARLECLRVLQEVGYQVGTGVMIGLPGQSVQDLASDLEFLKDQDIDMCGMGPYIEHPDAPLGVSEWSLEERFALALRMIALLRIMMPTINIASTTALHALDPMGREKGVAAGANIIMPNVTPDQMRPQYKLYNNKPISDIDLTGFDVGYGEWGDSRHFGERLVE